MAVNPCCFVEGGSTKYCKGCITVMRATCLLLYLLIERVLTIGACWNPQAICQRGIQGRIGRCPTCYSLITIRNGVVQTCTQVTGRCRACCQERILVDSTQNRLCDKCLLGASFRFRYQCQGCGKDQVIPHPMWLYQESPEEFGNVTWACHRDCHNFTQWRVHPDDASQIPPGKAASMILRHIHDAPLMH